MSKNTNQTIISIGYGSTGTPFHLRWIRFLTSLLKFRCLAWNTLSTCHGGKNIIKRWFPEDVGKPKTTYMRYMYPNLDVWCIILYIWLSFVSSKCSEIYSSFFSLGLIGFDQLNIQGPMPMQDRTVSNNNSKRRFKKCVNCKKQLHGTSNRKMNEELFVLCIDFCWSGLHLVCFVSFKSCFKTCSASHLDPDSSGDYDRRTPLHLACASGNHGAVEATLETDALIQHSCTFTFDYCFLLTPKCRSLKWGIYK